MILSGVHYISNGNCLKWDSMVKIILGVWILIYKITINNFNDTSVKLFYFKIKGCILTFLRSIRTRLESILKTKKKKPKNVII